MGFARDVANRVAFLEDGSDPRAGAARADVHRAAGGRRRRTLPRSDHRGRPDVGRRAERRDLSPDRPRLACSCRRSRSRPSSGPSGDQPEAIEQLVEGVQAGEAHRSRCSGRPGTGKTFTIAHVIEQVQRPTLVIAPNKSLAAQLAQRVPRGLPGQRRRVLRQLLRLLPARGLRPADATPTSRRTASVNDEIERLRHSATAALLVAARRPDRGERLVHLRPRLARGVRGAAPAAVNGTDLPTASSRCSGSSTSSTSATT